MCEIDTGAGCNVLPKYLKCQITNIPLESLWTARITAYGNNQVPVIGSLQTEAIVQNNECHEIKWQVTDTKGPAILGLSSAKLLGYVSLPAVTQPDLPNTPIQHTEVQNIVSKCSQDSKGSAQNICTSTLANDRPEIPKLIMGSLRNLLLSIIKSMCSQSPRNIF